MLLHPLNVEYKVDYDDKHEPTFLHLARDSNVVHDLCWVLSHHEMIDFTGSPSDTVMKVRLKERTELVVTGNVMVCISSMKVMTPIIPSITTFAHWSYLIAETIQPLHDYDEP
ncbi:hypothetical protein E2C01_043729 [Portunus trituberculatus]|uniref:Uncharacterized protein n=1 Tax=Portunus trituberculatus TaxID=210409 RepID=A0A5B7G0B6_PORTR|nr:hypothetical protein [Portunus trituberculatus]